MNNDFLTQQLKIAQKHLNLRDYEKALEYYNNILKSEKNNFDALLGAAECLYETNSNDDNLFKICKKIIDTDPQNIKILNYMGILLCNKSNFLAAIESYDKIINIEPKIAEIWYNKAICLHALKKFKKALACCNKALEINPNLSYVKSLKANIENEFSN